MPVKSLIQDTPFKYYSETCTYVAKTSDLKAVICMDQGKWACALVLRIDGLDHMGRGKGSDPSKALARAKIVASKKPPITSEA